MKTSGYLTMADGTDIFYSVIGEGKPVLFLHGNGGNSRFFRYQVAPFKHYFQLIFLDSRAHGKSNNWGEQLNFRLMARDTKEALDALGVEKTSIVGFSDGANLAMAFAALYPEVVSKLVLNSGNLFFSGTKLIGRITSYMQYAFGAALNMISEKFKDTRLKAKLLVKDPDISEGALRHLRCPAMVIVGARDVVETAHSKYIASLIPNCRYVEVAKEGHRLARTNARVFNQIVINFLKGAS
ncbi:alpha/beta fold hydrolase [Peptoniphilus sp. HCN-40583]|uniref:alpha/beta fold hydrolase n=1 Tax=Peptoniphilus sp. HCN-40583 TaxID=3134662 RepID=UPI0030C2F5A6